MDYKKLSWKILKKILFSAVLGVFLFYSTIAIARMVSQFKGIKSFATLINRNKSISGDSSLRDSPLIKIEYVKITNPNATFKWTLGFPLPVATEKIIRVCGFDSYDWSTEMLHYCQNKLKINKKNVLIDLLFWFIIGFILSFISFEFIFKRKTIIFSALSLFFLIIAIVPWHYFWYREFNYVYFCFLSIIAGILHQYSRDRGKLYLWIADVSMVLSLIIFIPTILLFIQSPYISLFRIW